MANNKKRPGDVAAPLRAMDKLAFCGATLSTVQSTTAAQSGQRSIADLLGTGRESAITRRELEQLTGLDGRSVRLLIERERRAGTPILADSTNGYFLPATDDERAACVRSLRHRAREILTTARAVERGKIEYEEGL